MTRPILTRQATAHDLEKISALHARVFGPGRFARTAYRVREGSVALSRFCRVAAQDGRLIAAVKLTEAAVGGKSGAALLGPVAVDPEFRGQGYGRRLVGEAMDEMKSAGLRLVVLVGDLPYYERFGFRPATPGSIRFPGPVNPARILIAELQDGSEQDYRGLVTTAV